MFRSEAQGYQKQKQFGDVTTCFFRQGYEPEGYDIFRGLIPAANFSGGKSGAAIVLPTGYTYGLRPAIQFADKMITNNAGEINFLEDVQCPFYYQPQVIIFDKNENYTIRLPETTSMLQPGDNFKCIKLTDSNYPITITDSEEFTIVYTENTIHEDGSVTPEKTMKKLKTFE